MSRLLLFFNLLVRPLISMLEQKVNVQRVVILLLIISVTFLFYFFGRSIWHPVIVRIIGGTTVGQRLGEIERKKPELASIAISKLSILCFKKEKLVEIYCDNKLYKTYPILAASGKLGPKIKEGDRQVPEGIYTFDSANPDSSYYLSLRISYPNDDDIKRSTALGIGEIGGDIYMHGKSLSIGCIAIGDDAIEDVFYLANKNGLKNTEILISPIDFRTTNEFKDFINIELYTKLSRELSKFVLTSR